MIASLLTMVLLFPAWPAWLLLATPPRVLGLAEAIETATRNQPELRRVRALSGAARSRADQARAPLLPQVTGTAAYQRTTANFALRPGSVPRAIAPGSGGSSFDTFNYFNLGANASILLWDFGQTPGRWRAAQANAEAQEATERATRQDVLLDVRSAYFNARAQRALLDVARETLANQERHRKQIEGFVRIGTRPEIDLAQAETDKANAEVQLINADNGYATARARLNQAMGVEGSIEYEVADETIPPVDGEEASIDELVERAARARPELLAFERQIRAQELTIRSLRGGYGPSLSASTGVTDAGTELGNLVWNWNGGVTLTWQLFQGLLTRSQVREAEYLRDTIVAQRDALRQQVRLEVDQARLAVRAGRAALVAAQTALENARKRLTLAERRYETGVGNAIELGDAQVAMTSAASQRVSAEYNLATSRAQLLKALGT